jgi:ribosome biogenesis protein Nip4
MDSIEQFTRQFTDWTIPDTLKIGRCYYQAEPGLRELVSGIEKRTGIQPNSAGLFLGEEVSRKFRPSIALLDMVGAKTDRWVIVDDKAEWLFLCGRDVFFGAVVRSNVRSGVAIVLNSKKEVLGYGLVSEKAKKNEDIMIKNILDRGDYLRREMGKRKH